MLLTRSFLVRSSKLSSILKPSIIVAKPRLFSTSDIMAGTIPKKTQDFLDIIKLRRSNYTLSKESTIDDAGVQEIIEQALEEVPSTFGAYTTRIVLATGPQHDKFWDLTTEVIKGITPPEQFESSTKGRLAGFKGGYGTILFFESPESTRALQDKFPFIKDKFVEWSGHTNACHQFAIWTALTAGGNGANLQHYNPVIDERVKKEFSIPSEWDLVAQLVYGKPTAPAGPKPLDMKKPLNERLIVAGKQ